MKRIGIFGGSFDPVHYGHLGLANDAMRQVGLERVVFIPAGQQPFKLDKKVTSGTDRLAMLDLATQVYDNFETSDFELNSQGISYTYLTMRHMQMSFGDEARLYFITGSDTFLKIETWKEAGELLSRYSFVIGTRPGFEDERLDICMKRIKNSFGTEIRTIQNTELDISSTEIRSKLENGEFNHKLIPRKVGQYIKENGLYANTDKD